MFQLNSYTVCLFGRIGRIAKENVVTRQALYAFSRINLLCLYFYMVPHISATAPIGVKVCT